MTDFLTISRDQLSTALDYEFPEPTAEHVWGHLEAFASEDADLRERIAAILHAEMFEGRPEAGEYDLTAYAMADKVLAALRPSTPNPEEA